jgi:perosamine synthetase
MLEKTVGLIPRFHWEYSLGDILRAARAALFRHPPAPDRLNELFGGVEPVYTTSGRTSLYVILKALQLGEGSGVGVPLFCCSVVFDAIARAGLVPVFIDTAADGFDLSLADLNAKRHRISALIVTHMFGQPADMDAITEVCQGIPVIEDCAHSLLSTYKGSLTGLLGTASFFSFRSGKYISAGQGSILLIRDPSLRRRAEELAGGLKEWSVSRELLYSAVTYLRSVFYRRPLYGLVSYPIVRPLEQFLNLAGREGFSFRKIARSHRTLLDSRLRSFHENVRQQRANAAMYRESLAGLPVGLPPAEQPGSCSNAYIFAITLQSSGERDSLASHLLRNGIDTAPYMSEIVDLARSRFGYRGDCPNAELRSQTVLLIPHYYALTRRDLTRITGSLAEGLRKMAAVASVSSLFLLRYFYML